MSTLSDHKTIRLVTTGRRDFTDVEFTAEVMSGYKKVARKRNVKLVVVQGGAIGSDTLVHNWGKANGVPCFTCEAQWDYYGNSAGPTRNNWMNEFFMPTHGFVFPGGKGTRDMWKKMRAAGL